MGARQEIIMKTESVKEVSLLIQLSADYGVSQSTVAGLAILGAIAVAALFATYASRWI